MKLSRKQEAYILMALQFPTYSDEKLAKLSEVNPLTISKGKNNPEFRAEYDRIIKEQGASAVALAKQRIVDIAENGSETNSLNASKFIMESNNFNAPQKVEVKADINTIKVTVDDN